jgi:hypothetical protein
MAGGLVPVNRQGRDGHQFATTVVAPPLAETATSLLQLWQPRRWRKQKPRRRSLNMEKLATDCRSVGAHADIREGLLLVRSMQVMESQA